MNNTKPFLVIDDNEFVKTRLIDNDNKYQEAIPTKEAIKIASAAGLDLVCIVCQSEEVEPLCKVMDYGRWRYEEEKKKKKQKKNQRHDIKEIRFTPAIGEHDLSHKIKHAKEFIENGHEVILSMRIKGRQSKIVAKERMDSIVEQASSFAIITSRKDDHNNITVKITKQKE